jgi:hypothetical protein
VNPIGYVGPIRATLRPDGRYQDYYVPPEQSTARLWEVVTRDAPEMPRVTPANDDTFGPV